MIRIAYLSTAAQPPGAADLEAILATSRANNQACGVTGLLCHYDGNYLQFLEGAAADVDATLDRIARDRRHHSLLKLYREPAEARLFPQWTMSVVDPQAISAEHRGFCEGLRELSVGLSAEHARAVTPFLSTFRAWIR